ncbi:MAG TPA: T9SS type A sorting domain-containing protein [Saprospiraceae bacterium]|nr:T9SS type A sorting domain-containing protein [Saprospiraceae bacterium]
MKRAIHIILFLFGLTSLVPLQAQTKVDLNISHLFGHQPFAPENVGINDLNTPFKIERLEYYISDIILVHDGGVETKVPDYWILADISKRGSYELGSFDIKHLEKVIFHIGVDPEHNNADPSVYPADHPLALKEPAMHWGWAAGYIFIALNGNGGDNLDNPFQVHALGNENYYAVELEMNIDAVNGSLTIPIDANYDLAMKGMDASIGIFYHGPTKFGAILATNFANYVFSKRKSPASTHSEAKTGTQFLLYPNQLTGGSGLLLIEGKFDHAADLIITNGLGKVVRKYTKVHSGATIEINDLKPGIYFASLVKGGMPSGTQKLLIF